MNVVTRVAATTIGGLVLLAATVGARPAEFPSALYDALAHTDGVADCAAAKHESAAAAAKDAFDVATVRLASGVTVYRAQGADPCLGARPNGPISAYVLAGSAVRQVLAISAIFAKFGTDGSVVTSEEGSAATTYRETFRYDGTRYARVRTDETFMVTGESKQIDVPARFAAGASSATVSGKVVASFGDSFVLDAAKGQTLSVAVHVRSGHIASLAIISRKPGDDAPASELTPPLAKALSWRGKLPTTGRYEIDVEGADDTPATYAMTIAIE
jgi:hypothetical protein